MRDKDTSAFREMFQYPSWLWPSSRPNQMDLILMDYCTWQFLVSLRLKSLYKDLSNSTSQSFGCERRVGKRQWMPICLATSSRMRRWWSKIKRVWGHMGRWPGLGWVGWRGEMASRNRVAEAEKRKRGKIGGANVSETVLLFWPFCANFRCFT